MRTENVANNKHEQFFIFWILIKLNFIPTLIFWKNILYLENFPTQHQQPTL